MFLDYLLLNLMKLFLAICFLFSSTAVFLSLPLLQLRLVAGLLNPVGGVFFLFGWFFVVVFCFSRSFLYLAMLPAEFKAFL